MKLLCLLPAYGASPAYRRLFRRLLWRLSLPPRICLAVRLFFSCVLPFRHRHLRSAAKAFSQSFRLPTDCNLLKSMQTMRRWHADSNCFFLLSFINMPKVWIINGLFATCDSLCAEWHLGWGDKFVWIGSSHAHRIDHTECHTHIYLMEMTTMKISLMPHVSNWDDRALAHQPMRKSNSIISQRSKVTRCDSLTRMPATQRERERETMKSKPNCSSEQERIYEQQKNATTTRFASSEWTRKIEMQQHIEVALKLMYTSTTKPETVDKTENERKMRAIEACTQSARARTSPHSVRANDRIQCVNTSHRKHSYTIHSNSIKQLNRPLHTARTPFRQSNKRRNKHKKNSGRRWKCQQQQQHEHNNTKSLNHFITALPSQDMR